MIPKRIFFYWGNDKMSWMRYMSLYSFRKLNPEWEMILYKSKQDIYEKKWNCENIQDFFSFDGVDYLDKIKELNIKIIEWEISDNKIKKDLDLKNISSSHKSNFLKWSKLYEDGGFYSDLDILYIRPIDNLYNHIIENNYNGIICQSDWISIGFLASEKNNNFFKDVFNNSLKTYNDKTYQSAGVISIYNMLYNMLFNDKNVNNSINTKNALKNINKLYKNINFYNIPFHVVYPFIFNNDIPVSLNNIMKINYDKKLLNTLKEDTIGFHWYAGYNLSQKLNNLLNNDNYNDYNNIITDLINKFNIL